MSKVVRVQEGDYKVLLGKNGVPNNFIIDTNAGSFNGATGEVIIKGDLSVTGNAPSPEVSNVMYVTVDGNDANDGKGEGPGQAKRTIKAAVAAAQEGTTIFVRSGEYYEDNPIRLPPKVSIIGDNLRRTILRPLNGPRKFSATSIERTNTVVTVTTSTPHEFKLHDRVRVIIPDPATPNDRTTHILDTECANITEVVDATTFKYIDPNFTDIPLTLTTIGTVEQGIDFFLVTNQSYIAQLVFRGFQAPGYCLNIDRDAIVDTSPYIQNCSNINGPWLRNGTEWLPFITEQPNLAGEMVKGPRPLRDDEIDPAQVDQYGVNDRGAGGGMLIDGDRYNSESPLKSMVADAFTQVAQGGVGFHISNFGYMQLVSCFAVFCDKAFYTTNGGYLSISNSVIDFGNYGFLADGFYPTPYATGLVTTPYYSNVGSISVTNEGSGYTSVPNTVIDPPDPLIPGGIQATALVNIDNIRQTINAITPNNTGFGYTFKPEIRIASPIGGLLDPNWAVGNSFAVNDYVLLANGLEYQVTSITGTGTIQSGDPAPGHTSGAVIIGEIEFTYVGRQAKAIVNLATNTSINVAQLSEKPQVGSILFVGDDPLGYYIKSTNNANLGFKFNELKCRRDVGLIVDAVLADAVFNTNFRTLYAARAYLRSYSSKVLSLQKAQTLNGIMVARDQVQSLMGGLVSTPVGGSTLGNVVNNLFNLVLTVIFPEFDPLTYTPGDPTIPAEGIQENDPILIGSVPDPNASAISVPAPVGRTAGFVEAGNILQANKTFIQDQIVNYINNLYKGFVYDSATCSRDVGLIVDAVSYDLATGSNFASIVAGSAYQRAQSSGVTGGQLPQTLDAIRYARDLTLTYVEGSIQFRIATSFNNVLNILENGLGAAPTSVFPQNGSSSTTAIADSQTIRDNIETYQDAVISYIATNYPALVYDETLCRRDVGYVVNAVSYDLLYGGNYQSVIAGQAYYSGTNLQIPLGEKAATLDAYDYLRTLIQTDVPNSFTTAGDLVDDIISIVDTGVSPTIVYPSVANENEVVIAGFNNIQANKTIIQDSTVAYVDATYNSLGYNSEKCARDIGIIVESVFDDLVFGSNYKTKTAGLSYLRSYTNKVTEKQKIPTIGGIERARDLVLKYLQDELDSEITINNLFNNVIEIIRKEDAVDVPETFYTPPTDNVEFNARTIESSKIQIINAVIEFINQNLNPENIVNYQERLCRRDLNYILEAVIYDLIYGGNSATVNVAKSFYTAGGLNVVSTQIAEHVDAFEYLKILVGAPGSALIDIVINAIDSGQGTIPVATPPSYTRGSLYQYYLNFRDKILGTNPISDPGLLPSIKDEVIEFIDNTYRLNFEYDESVCRRDIDYIVDALTYDLTYGGNTQTTNAALAYSEGSVIAGEINETVEAYKYWKQILPFILQNDPVPNALPGQVLTTPTGNPVPDYYPSFIAQNLLQIVVDALDYGPGHVPEPVTEAEFNLGNTTVLGFKNTVIDNLSSIQNSVINYLNIKYGGDINVEVFPGIIDIPANTTIRFHNVSTISTGGTALEYVGAGVTYNALPFFGGEPIPENERIELNNGRCFTVSNDQVGNFRVGSLFAVDALTGGVTIDANNVSLSGIGSIGPFLRNGIPVGVELQEVSNNANLISSLGTQDVNTVPTQFAVATYVENRYLNKVQSDTPQTVESEVAFQNNVTIEGNLTVNGATTTIESTTLVVEDPNITIGKDNTTDAQADGGGITLVGATNKTISWNDTTDAWNSSEHWNLANTRVYRINGTNVLSSTSVLDNAATVTAFSTSTSLTVGATTGTATIRNATTVLSGDLEVRGGDITTDQSAFNLLNTNALTLNIGSAAATARLGATSGTLTLGNPTVVGTQTTQSLYNSVAETVNAFGAATSITLAATTGTTRIRNNVDIDGNIEVGGNIIPTTNELQDLGSPTNRFRDLYVSGASIFLGDVILTDAGFLQLNSSIELGGDSLTTTSTTFNVVNDVAQTINAFGAATSIDIGAATGTVSINNALVDLDGDLNVDGGDITTNLTGTFNLLNTNATTINAFGAATSITLGATTGTLTVRNTQTVFSSTDSIRIPVGTTAQRDATPEVGQIRYNTELSSFEGFGPGNNWGSLGGVKDVDGDTFILAELTPANDDDTLTFVNGTVTTLTITATEFDLKAPVSMRINNTTNSTSSTTGALIVAGGIGVANDIVGAGWTVSSIQQFEIDEGEY